MPGLEAARSLTLGAAIALLLLAAAARADEIVVGVISPLDAGRAIGAAHEETIRFALDKTGGVIQAGSIAVPLRVEYRSDRGDPERAVAEARTLVDDGAVAILGPVDSRSTQAVLDARLGVPVISALSSATFLTKPTRDEWFFRMTLSDDERMRQYAATLRKRELLAAPVFVLYDATSPYGVGLKDEIARELSIPPASALPWDVNPTDVAFAFDPAPATVFVLGTSAGAAPIANAVQARFLESRLRPPRFLFVGDDSDLRDGAPYGSLTIGDPTIVDGPGSAIAALRDEYAKVRKQDPDSLIVTAYEAAHYVLLEALQSIVADGISRSPAELRSALRVKLGTLRFESLEAWREMRLRNGALEGAPPVPVYQVNPHLDVKWVEDPQPYLEVEAPKQAGLFQGQVTLRARPHRIDRTPELNVFRVITADQRVPVPSTRKEVDGATEVTFYPLLPGEYELRSELKMQPRRPKTEVAPSFAYPVAALGAFFASCLYTLSVTIRGGRRPRWRILTGTLTGLVLAAADFHRATLPGGAAIPSFSTTPLLAALFNGLAGGWVGPGVIFFILERFFPSLSGAREKDEPPKPEAGALPAGHAA